jgi:hypothetical protein
MDVYRFHPRDLVELEPADIQNMTEFYLQLIQNMTEFYLQLRVGPFIKDVLPMFKRWRQLRCLAVRRGSV